MLDNMQEVFLPRDELLSSAGPVPVYYWIVREMPFESQTVLREFLLAFERERSLNRVGQIKGTLDEERPVFAHYDALNRSINDVGSHVGRFEILRDEFRAWLDQSLPSHTKFVLKH